MMLEVDESCLPLGILLDKHLQDSLFVLFVRGQMVGRCLQWRQKTEKAFPSQHGEIFGLAGHGMFSGIVEHSHNAMLYEDSCKENQKEHH
jgi:hypothetical protein